MFSATTRISAAAALVTFVCVSVAAVENSSVESAQQPAGQILLRSGDYYSGALVDTERAGAVAWQTEFAEDPYVIPLDKLRSALFRNPTSPVPQQGEFCFELHGGQAIYGTPLATTDDSFVVNSPRFGRLTLDKSAIARFYRSGGIRGGLADGLQGLTGWTVEGLPSDWREEAGAIVTETRGASLAQEIAVPTRFWVEIDAEWTKDFGIKFDFGDVFRIESWMNDVLVAREVHHTQKRLVPAADVEPTEWRYTFDKPVGDWQRPDFDDSKWKIGKSGFGQPGMPHAGTVWETPVIWIRRTFDMPQTKDRPYLYLFHDEDAKVYINGVLAVEAASFNNDYEVFPITDEALTALKPTGNVMAIHCLQTGGGQYIDAGIVSANMPPDKLLADLARVPSKGGGNGIHVRCYVDRQTGEVKVVDFADKSLTTIQVKPVPPVVDSLETILLRLTSYSSRLQIKQLVVSEWDGKEPTFESQDRLRLRLTDGRLIEGDSLSIAEGSDQLAVASGQASSTFPHDQVKSVTFGARAYGSTQPYWLSLHDGTFLSGELTRVEQGTLYVRTSLSEQDLAIPAGELRSLTNIAPIASKKNEDAKPAGEDSSDAQNAKQSVLLEAEGVVSRGALTGSSPSEVALGMSWQPTDSLNASALRRDARLRIAFRAESKQPVEKEDPRMAIYRIQGLLPPEASAPEEEKGAPAPGLDGAKEFIVLVNGDRLEGRVTKFDQTGLEIESELISERFIPADQVHVWETNRETWLEHMDKEKRRRLLTLPRKQRDSPPTHIVESVTGDFMRTRIVSADDSNIYTLMQRKERSIPRSMVQRVVWLPPTERKRKDETPAENNEPIRAADAFGPGTAQARIGDSLQVTMKLDGIVDGRLVGESSLLGRCNVAVDQIAELRLGGTVIRDANALANTKWRLHDAIDPIYMQDKELEENGRMTAGLTFPLVGKAAPDFNAPTLAGDPIQLSSLRGRVIVLDFWATWCGPCIQAIPEIVSVVESYDESKVQLISVNMGEDKASMVACLEQLKLSPLVAMDVRGQVANQYLVKSIPQTVVISPRGEVARVFVGSSPQLGKQLRFAIDELLTQ